MKRIALTQGKFALVDDEDFERLNQVKWHARRDCKTFYAVRRLPTINGKQRHSRMHHEIIGRPPKGLGTDYRDGNGINNQRKNLRFVTSRQNNQNINNMKKSSRYPGVYWDKGRQKWRSHIKINGVRKYLGRFIKEIDAFNAYRQAVEAIGEEVLL